jgi:hypothetical protein
MAEEVKEWVAGRGGVFYEHEQEAPQEHFTSLLV